MNYPDLTDLPLRFDLQMPAADGIIHPCITLRTVKALRTPGAKLFLDGEHLYTFSERDTLPPSGLFWGFARVTPHNVIELWATNGLAATCEPGECVDDGDYTIAQYGGAIAFGRQSCRTLLAERNAKHGPPQPKPQLYLHLTFAHPAAGLAHKSFGLKWGEAAPKEAVDFVLEHAMFGRKFTRALLSVSPDPDAKCVYRVHALGSDAASRLIRGAKLDEVWTCK